MSQETTIRKLAELVNTPVEKLLEQLAEAGMKFGGPDQAVTSTEKMKLLGFLRRTKGKADEVVEDPATPKKITLNRRKVQEVTVSAGRSKTTVAVEVRQKRTYVKPEGGAAASKGRAVDDRDEILRKLEESRQRNLAEQQHLAEVDRARAEERARREAEEAAERQRIEAERKAAE
ncbi:MAG TPA: translation initiation factor IF-2, partial [Xanthomonadaceae bacterium]|nr:translation initiation factor IF-2 [Xanthomonadaceae bacterium]